MKKTWLLKLSSIILILSLLMTDVGFLLPAGGIDQVQAGAPGPNVIIGFLRFLGAWGARNRLYREARATSAEINAYYDQLIAKAQEVRREMIQKAAEGGRTVMARSYIRIEAALEAERAMAIEMIEQEKNQARQDFNRAATKAITNVLVASPGGQRIIGRIRETIGEAREAAVAVQIAAEGGKPIEALTDALAEKVGGAPIVQDLVKQGGSILVRQLDKGLGGAFTKVEKAMSNIQGEMGGAITTLDQLDSDVAQIGIEKKEPISVIESGSALGKIVPVDRANPVIDVLSSAYAGAAALSGKVDARTSRSTMRDRIRDALLTGRMTGIQGLKTSGPVGQTYCTNVGRGQYENAATQLGDTPEIPENPDLTRYMVCYNILTQDPQFAKMFEAEKKAEDTPEPLVVEGTIPVGAYVGTTDYSNVIELVFNPGTITQNEVMINIDDAGSVTGSLSLYYIGDTFIREDNDCEGHWEVEMKGTFSGQLIGPAGVIDLTESWDCTLIATCSDTGECDEEPFVRQLNIEVIGDQMTGSTLPLPEDPDGLMNWSLTAKKK
jgi:hypothetical protein